MELRDQKERSRIAEGQGEGPHYRRSQKEEGLEDRDDSCDNSVPLRCAGEIGTRCHLQMINVGVRVVLLKVA